MQINIKYFFYLLFCVLSPHLSIVLFFQLLHFAATSSFSSCVGNFFYWVSRFLYWFVPHTSSGTEGRGRSLDYWFTFHFRCRLNYRFLFQPFRKLCRCRLPWLFWYMFHWLIPNFRNGLILNNFRCREQWGRGVFWISQAWQKWTSPDPGRGVSDWLTFKLLLRIASNPFRFATRRRPLTWRQCICIRWYRRHLSAVFRIVASLHRITFLLEDILHVPSERARVFPFNTHLVMDDRNRL